MRDGPVDPRRHQNGPVKPSLEGTRKEQQDEEKAEREQDAHKRDLESANLESDDSNFQPVDKIVSCVAPSEQDQRHRDQQENGVHDPNDQASDIARPLAVETKSGFQDASHRALAIGKRAYRATDYCVSQQQ